MERLNKIRGTAHLLTLRQQTTALGVVVHKTDDGVSITTATNVTITAAQVATGRITRDCAGAGRSDTLPDAADVISTLGLEPGDWFMLELVNASDAAETQTLSGGTGNTVVGTLDVAQNESTLVLAQCQTATTMRYKEV